QRPELAGKSNGHQAGNEPLRSKALQLIPGQQRHGQSEEKRDQPHKWYRVHTGADALAKKARCSEWDAPLLHTLHGFLKRVHDEPEDAADLAQESALDLNDLERSRAAAPCFSVSHGREVASLSDGEKRKFAGNRIAPQGVTASQPSRAFDDCPRRRSLCIRSKRADILLLICVDENRPSLHGQLLLCFHAL